MTKKAVTLITAASLAACLSVAGCSNKLSVEDGQAKIEELAEKGVPERDMSKFKRYLSQMEGAKRIGNSGQFRLFQDSLTRGLEEFETQMTALLADAGPFMDSVRKACDEKLAQLNGVHLETAKKWGRPVDSLMGIASQKLNARYRLETWANELDTLILAQRLADSLRGQFTGLWVMELVSDDPRHKVVERKEIHMRPDNTLLIMESKAANTPEMRENYRFESIGTWDLLGDMAQHYITREKRVLEEFEAVDPQTGRWRRDVKRPYDSVVVDGKKDRDITWSELNNDYKRFPIRGRR